MDPIISDIATGYEVAFAEEPGDEPYITFRCEHVEAISWGLLATVLVTSPLTTHGRHPGNAVLLDRVNLMKSRDRREMGIRLSQVLAAPTSSRQQDWERHLELIAVAISERMGQPIPQKDLQHEPLPDPQRFLVPGLLAEGKTNVLYGPGGTGKSLLAVRTAVSVESGIDLWGIPVRHTGPVLYLDWEDDADTMVERLELVCRGLGIKRIPFAYKSLVGRGAYERHHADVRFYLERNPTALVIFDSTALAMHGGSAGDGADGALKFFSLISQLPATRLLIDHIASDDIKKDGDKGAAKPYGSVFKVNAARNVWEVAPFDEQGVVGFTLRHRKSNVGPRLAPYDVAVTWRDDKVMFDAI